MTKLKTSEKTLEKLLDHVERYEMIADGNFSSDLHINVGDFNNLLDDRITAHTLEADLKASREREKAARFAICEAEGLRTKAATGRDDIKQALGAITKALTQPEGK